MCGSLLVAKKKKRKRPSYKCTESSERLNSVFNIDITNDLPEIHPLLVCYLCKRGDGQMYNILQLHKHLPFGGTLYILMKMYGTIKAYTYMYVHVKLTMFTQICQPKRGDKHTQAHPRGWPTTINSITACIKGIVLPHHSPNRDVQLASTNNLAILDHL